MSCCFFKSILFSSTFIYICKWICDYSYLSSCIFAVFMWTCRKGFCMAVLSKTFNNTHSQLFSPRLNLSYWPITMSFWGRRRSLSVQNTFNVRWSEFLTLKTAYISEKKESHACIAWSSIFNITPKNRNISLCTWTIASVNKGYE